MDYKVISSEEVFKGKMIDVKVDQIQYDNGDKARREVALHPGGAVVTAYHEGKIILVNQYRYPIQRRILELPAGKLDNKEAPESCAMRELQEETGYKTEKLIKLGEILPSPGFCDEVLYLYFTNQVSKGETNRDEGEHAMETVMLSPDEMENMILENKITDAKTIIGFFLSKKYFNKA
jgi:ADP-ribose pyrophosphatase